MTEQQATERARMLTALRAFICQRPGLEPGNYASAADYRSELRDIARDRADALTLYDYVARQAIGLGPEYLTPDGTSRLTWNGARGEWEYTTGQYFPVEYRPAAARLLASALWQYWRDGMGPDVKSPADAIRNTARLAFRSRRVRRYFL